MSTNYPLISVVNGEIGAINVFDVLTTFCIIATLIRVLSLDLSSNHSMCWGQGRQCGRTLCVMKNLRSKDKTDTRAHTHTHTDR